MTTSTEATTLNPMSLASLAQDVEDPLQSMWLKASQVPADKASALVLGSFAAIQSGQRARRTNKRREDCPYPAPDGEPTRATDYLNLAWNHGFKTVDDERNRVQCEKKIEDAYDNLQEAYDIGEEALLTLSNMSRHGFTQHEFNARAENVTLRVRRAQDLMRQVKGTILTGAIKAKRHERWKAHEALLAEDELEEPVEPNADGQHPNLA
jgi:hypothetical protein